MKMRFLCLHGMGTNGDIFELQTATLRHVLLGEHEYEFVDGSLSTSELAPGVEQAFGEQEEYYELFAQNSPESILRAVQDVADLWEADGPFDGVWGFSQGGAVAATLMAARHQGIVLKEGQPLPELKIAVLFSATRPLDLRAAQSGQMKLLPKPHADCYNTTTIHFWDPADAAYPGHSEEVFEMCDSRRRSVVQHSAGHGIPSSSDREMLVSMAQKINEGLTSMRDGSRIQDRM